MQLLKQDADSRFYMLERRNIGKSDIPLLDIIVCEKVKILCHRYRCYVMYLKHKFPEYYFRKNFCFWSLN